MKTLLLVAGVTLFSTVLVCVVWYASSPNLCTIAMTRGLEDRFASPHRGALLVESGRLIGGRDGRYMFECACGKYPLFSGADISPVMLASLETRRRLAELRNDDFRRKTRLADVTMVAVLEANVVSCFTSGIVIRPVMMSVGPPKTTPRTRHGL